MINTIKKIFGSGTDYKLLMKSGAIIVDVRTEGEFKTGHIEQSINIPLDSISGKIAELKKKKQTNYYLL